MWIFSTSIQFDPSSLDGYLNEKPEVRIKWNNLVIQSPMESNINVNDALAIWKLLWSKQIDSSFSVSYDILIHWCSVHRMGRIDVLNECFRESFHSWLRQHWNNNNNTSSTNSTINPNPRKNHYDSKQEHEPSNPNSIEDPPLRLLTKPVFALMSSLKQFHMWTHSWITKGVVNAWTHLGEQNASETKTDLETSRDPILNSLSSFGSKTLALLDLNQVGEKYQCSWPTWVIAIMLQTSQCLLRDVANLMVTRQNVLLVNMSKSNPDISYDLLTAEHQPTLLNLIYHLESQRSQHLRTISKLSFHSSDSVMLIVDYTETDIGYSNHTVCSQSLSDSLHSVDPVWMIRFHRLNQSHVMIEQQIYGQHLIQFQSSLLSVIQSAFDLEMQSMQQVFIVTPIEPTQKKTDLD